MADIGAVRVIFGADVAQLQEGIKKATDALGSFSKAAGAIAAGTGLERAVERTFDKIVESVDKAIESADKLSKASAKFGIPADSLQVLAHAAELSDVNLDTLGASIAKLSKNMIAAEGPTSDQAAAFKALGLSVSDLIKLSPDQAFLKIGDAISKYADGTTKTAAVQAIFGRGAADLIPILNQGSAGFNELKGRMQDYGQIISGPVLAASEKFKDTLNDLRKTQDTIILKILGDSGLLDAMNKLATSLVEAGGDSKKFNDNFGPLVDIIRGTITDVENLAAGFEKLKKAVADTSAAAVDGAPHALGFEMGLEGIGKAAQAAAPAIAKQGESIAETAGEYVKAADGVKAMQAAADAFANKPQLKFDPTASKNLEAFNKELAKLHAQVLDASGAFSSQLAPGFLAAAAGMEQLKGQVTLTGDGLVKLGPQAEAFNQEMLKLKGTQDALALADPWAKFQAELPGLIAGWQAAGKSVDEVADLTERAAERAGVSWKNATTEILQNAASGFAALAQKNKEFAGIAKGLAIAEATWNTYQAATKAIATYPPPFGEIAAAAAVVAGLGMVAKITATSYAKGGSFKVPGGMSGVDNQLVPLALASGEQVDITPAGQAAGGAGRAQRIELSGVGPRDLFTGSMLRDLFDALNQGQRDGYRLVISER